MGLVPFLQDSELRRRAASFLREHGAADCIPVPIEEIVEFRLGLNIVPAPLLSSSRGINGYLSADRSAIYVDEHLFRNVETRYLFTVAHEVAHLVLHQHVYKSFASDSEWREFHARLAQQDLKSAEYQADCFAGLILMPEATLRASARTVFEELSRQSGEARIDRMGDPFWTYVARELGIRYRTSQPTARIRLENDGFWRKPL